MPFQWGFDVCFMITGKSRNDRVHSLSTKLSVDQEYLEVFRTKSYEEMCDRVQGQLGRTNTSRLSSSSSLPIYLDLSEYLLELRQETLKDIIGSLNFHYLLVDYFGASLQACNICELLLKGIHQTRSAYKNIRMVIKSSKRLTHGYSKEDKCRAILRELNALALLKNPLSIISPVQFRDIHDEYLVLLHRLTSKHKKIKRITKLKKMVCLFGLCKKKMEPAQGWIKTRLYNEGLGEQLDMAAKGVFIFINDFDTMSRMVRRLHDEVEHRKYVAGMCVRNGKCELAAEVVREFDAQDRSFLEQLEELEEHIYLCLLTINRSRGLVIQEIMEATHS